ncbi:MAG TPA: hypothetical protein VIQ55_10595 [Burkholderiales bacterium]|jgi:hypothetical protein
MKPIAALTLSIALAGCAINFPQTAEEFRKAAPEATFGKTETIEVNRPFRQVASTFQRKAPECLNIAVRMTERSTTSYHVVESVYKPTVLVGKERAELHVQLDYKKGVIVPGKVPEGGTYLLVADAYPLSGNRTKLQWFGPSRGHDTLIRAVKGWATGENLGCPDLTK